MSEPTQEDLFISNVVNNVCDGLNITTEMGRAAVGVALENIVLLDRKQADYGSGNISAFGAKGVLVRCVDKTERLKQLVWKGNSPNNESISDSWQDLANYAVIAQLVTRGIWN